jgi:serine/threonine protein kinase
LGCSRGRNYPQIDFDKVASVVAIEHPAPEMLSDYALGRLPDDAFEAVAVHLEQCTGCQDTLSHLQLGDDTLVRDLGGPYTNDSFDDEPEFAAALSAIRRMDSGPAPDSTDDLSDSSLARVESDVPLDTLRDYELLAPLGRGGMGMVYRARHTRLDRFVAVKVLPAERMRQPEAIARFHREMKAVGNVDHANIVRAYDAGEVDGKHFLAMELLDGVDLAALADREGPLAVADACELVRQAAMGLHHAHQAGLVHRDVKPSNLFLDKCGAVKVLDLGLARLISEGAANEEVDADAADEDVDQPSGERFRCLGPELTGAGRAMGTPDYMAPEQCTNSRAVDARSDVYGLGATFYRLLSGRAPFSGAKYDTLAKKIAGLIGDPVPPITEFRNDLPAAVVRLLNRMLAKRPEDRPAELGEVAAALAPFCRANRVAELAGADRGAKFAAMSFGRRSGWRRPPVLIALAAAGFGAVAWLGVIITSVTTPYGELVVEAPPEARDKIRVEASNGGRQFTVSQDNAWRVSLEDGEWRVKLETNDDRFMLDRQTVEIKRGDRQLVRVALKPATPADRGRPEIGQSPVNQPRVSTEPKKELSELVVFNSDNNHYYLRSDEPMSWHDAKQYCEKRGGHLATIDKPTENDFIYRNFALDQACWLGASDETNEGAWMWVTGEPFAYTNWFHDEPANAGDGEDFLVIGNAHRSTQSAHYRYDQYWNDYAADGKLAGKEFILPLCEWETGKTPEDIMRRARQTLTGKEIVLAQFEPAKSKPLAPAAEPRLEVNAWQLHALKTETFPLFGISKPEAFGCVLAYRAEIKTEDVQGQAYLELAAGMPDGTHSYSRSIHTPLKGSVDWTKCEAPLLVEGRPQTLQMNLVIQGGGTVWVRNVSLVARPLPHRELPPSQDIGSRY